MEALVLNAINASLPRAITLECLRACLLGRTDRTPWLPHLRTFFDELSINVIEEFAAQQLIPIERLGAAFIYTQSCTGDAFADVEEWFQYMDAPAA